MAEHATLEQLESQLETVRRSPCESGSLELIVRRPGVGTREVLLEVEVSPTTGLAGDSWLERGSSRTGLGAADPDRQLTLMNSRAATLVAGDNDRWPLAGDQLYVDLNLSVENLPPGSRLAIGGAIVMVTAVPHNGCQKFATRFGNDAARFVNSPLGKQLRLRGINARVECGGTIQVGDSVRKLEQ